MNPKTLFIVLLLLAAPGVSAAQDRDDRQDVNVNSRYGVESVLLAGTDASSISKSLRADMQKLVGQNYDQGAVNDLAFRMREELRGYAINVKVERGDIAEHLKVTFEARKNPNRRFDVHMPALTYYSNEGWSGALDLGFDTHHNCFSFALLSTVDELLERNAGYRLRYEHRQVGTDAIWIGVELPSTTRRSRRPPMSRLRRRPAFPTSIACVRTSRHPSRCCPSGRSS